MPSSAARRSSGLSAGMALLQITHSTSTLTCWAACPEKQRTPVFISGSSQPTVRSEPLNRQPLSRRTRAMALMPAPPMPTRWALRAWPVSKIEVADPVLMFDSIMVNIPPGDQVALQEGQEGTAAAVVSHGRLQPGAQRDAASFADGYHAVFLPFPASCGKYSTTVRSRPSRSTSNSSGPGNVRASWAKAVSSAKSRPPMR